jgi:hypothetical protein
MVPVLAGQNREEAGDKSHGQSIEANGVKPIALNALWWSSMIIENGTYPLLLLFRLQTW